ncbi:hypothetical protein MCY_01376 [Bartonella rattimassiliensis 15908]|uniref:Uncharacterized protein n=1 Tax=Bartonella rattimassiliensis 15908 TaxID=1094556 RepID=J0ZAX7_9HYPH|nr:hypothetical protein MCY_01376 [Bartonella rattimassiliensis 15908]
MIKKAASFSYPKKMKKENSDKTLPVAILMHTFIFFFFKVVLANNIKMVIKVNHAKMWKEWIVTSSKPFLMLPPEAKSFGKAAM